MYEVGEFYGGEITPQKNKNTLLKGEKSLLSGRELLKMITNLRLSLWYH